LFGTNSLTTKLYLRTFLI